jgi:hypothetical protein
MDFVSLVRNVMNMKRRVLFGAGILLITWSVTSCEKLGGCKVCQDVTYENNVVVFASPEEKYCGADLLIKESTKDVINYNQVIKVECR